MSASVCAYHLTDGLILPLNIYVDNRSHCKPLVHMKTIKYLDAMEDPEGAENHSVHHSGDVMQSETCTFICYVENTTFYVQLVK